MVPAGPWVLISPEPPSSTQDLPPSTPILGGRPLPQRLRPALLLIVQPDRLVLTTQDGTRSSPRRWLSWAPGLGLQDVDPYPAASPSLLLHLAGAENLAQRAEQRTQLRAALQPEHRSPAVVADRVLTALGLPGAGFATPSFRPHRLPDAQLITGTPWKATP